MNQITASFVLVNESPTEDNPDVSPFRCAYCGELSIIERNEDNVPIGAKCDCEDALIETQLKSEVEELSKSLGEKNIALEAHMRTKAYDSDTKLMMYEDELKSLKIRFGITE
jgi:hypothetical protein